MGAFLIIRLAGLYWLTFFKNGNLICVRVVHTGVIEVRLWNEIALVLAKGVEKCFLY